MIFCILSKVVARAGEGEEGGRLQEPRRKVNTTLCALAHSSSQILLESKLKYDQEKARKGADCNDRAARRATGLLLLLPPHLVTLLPPHLVMLLLPHLVT